jgi:2-keto-4-pentenoate hydratase/2-oxohepta-3-ene-1,7-dioic acid hydratase in catechol pathway
VHGWLAGRLADPERLIPFLLPTAGFVPVLPFSVAGYVDFFACEQHARNAARIARPDGRLSPNWKHLPVGSHGRAGTVVVSGTPVARPVGQRGPGDRGPTHCLDVEAELGFVCGPSDGPVGMDAALDHVFGVVLLNDWSARDVQSWETRPLGPLLGKSFDVDLGVGRPARCPRRGLDGAGRARPRAATVPARDHRPRGSTSCWSCRSTARSSRARPPSSCTGPPPSSLHT